jgi:hypothetical protein
MLFRAFREHRASRSERSKGGEAWGPLRTPPRRAVGWVTRSLPRRAGSARSPLKPEHSYSQPSRGIHDANSSL